MKLLILGSVALPVPPPMQGGTERIAYWQARELTKRGHEVTLIAARGSKSEGYALVEIGGGDTVSGSSHEAQEGAGSITEGSRKLRKEAVYLAQVSDYLFAHGKEYDVIVNNMRAGESLFVPITTAIGVKYCSVMHLPLFTELAEYFRVHDTGVITISNAQRDGFDGLRYIGTVYNATDLAELPFHEKSKGYLLMMGSIAPHKNQKDGILAAKAVGKKIVLAGKIGNRDYWDREIVPFVDGATVVHKGELELDEKAALLGGADALLFPVIWPEPFGLVMIEAMAAGTPVIAYRNGAVPEVVAEGTTGFVVDETQGVGGLAVAIQRIGEIGRADCRKRVEDSFTVEKMIDSLEMALKNA